MYTNQNDRPTLLTVTRHLEVLDLGTLPYETAYLKQREIVNRKKQDAWESDYLLFVEHPEIYTFGRKSKNIPMHLPNVASVERGGEATFHNPGQLVCYPILSLEEKDRDVHGFLRKLEQCLISTLSKFGIKGARREGATGVWVGEKKIASIGIAFSNWISYHGLALNVNNDLDGFSKIDPCGFSAEVMTSMQELLGERCPQMEEVKTALQTCFRRQFLS